PFALRALLDDTIALVRVALADARQVALDATLPDGEPSLTVDRERVAQALWTLLTTAVEASAAGSRVAFACTRDGAQFTARATCTVNADVLVDPEQPHVFESFARREMLRERDAKRSAWTLALCQRVALAHLSRRADDRVEAAVFGGRQMRRQAHRAHRAGRTACGRMLGGVGARDRAQGNRWPGYDGHVGGEGGGGGHESLRLVRGGARERAPGIR
ncbi:hypothetical protein M3583_21875, partial [Bacillus subtilis]|nr:hypothetical protein [Bacillus subtilis]